LKQKNERRLKNKREMSLRDRLIVVAIWVVGFTSFLLIGLDPLDILDLNHKKIVLAVIISVVSLLLLLYHRQRIMKKMKNNPNNP
jgi:Mn2+/Fe2+ NRAMP family transporter